MRPIPHSRFADSADFSRALARTAATPLSPSEIFAIKQIKALIIRGANSASDALAAKFLAEIPERRAVRALAMLRAAATQNTEPTP